LVPIFARVEAWVGSWGDNRSFYLVLEEDLEPGTAYLVHLTGRILGPHKATRAGRDWPTCLTRGALPARHCPTSSPVPRGYGGAAGPRGEH